VIDDSWGWPSLEEEKALSVRESEARKPERTIESYFHNHDWYLIFLHSLSLLLDNYITLIDNHDLGFLITY